MPVRGASWVKTAASEKTRSRKVARTSSSVNNFNPFVTKLACPHACSRASSRSISAAWRISGGLGGGLAERQKPFQRRVEALQFGKIALAEVGACIHEGSPLAADLCHPYH